MATQLTLTDLLLVRAPDGQEVTGRITRRTETHPIFGAGPWCLVEWEELHIPTLWRPERGPCLVSCGLWFKTSAVESGVIDLPRLHDEYMAAWSGA